uniref:Centromere protein Cenp-F N-terminal domain-containing protein n=1 Tax=Pseudonaja textilis TaxID=8673 RepID=A0A670Z715_PSETE
MSWVVEEWKEGLSIRVLQKIHDLESQAEKFKKERQQRQFQLESLEAALEKQKQKVYSYTTICWYLHVGKQQNVVPILYIWEHVFQCFCLKKKPFY